MTPSEASWSSPPRERPLRGLALVGWMSVVLVLFCLAGCGGGPSPEERTLAGLVAAERYDLSSDTKATGDLPLLLPGEPRVQAVRIDHERRPAVLMPAGAWAWRTEVPEGARLELGVGAPRRSAPAAGAGADPGGAIEVTVSLLHDGEREVLEVARSGPAGEGVPGWLDLGADLSAYAGEEVELVIEARRLAASDGTVPAGPLAWAPAALAIGSRFDGSERGAERPNVLFIVIDTLRHDHLPFYGYERDTAPELARRLASRGVVMEDAYSQAPWTLPSVTSFLTSRFPGEILGEDPASFGVPAEVPSLPEEMERLGYRTAAFIANPALHEMNGFGRGFETFHSPEGVAAMELHADSVNRRVVPWLRAHQSDPFFLYVHYIDPHDPYWNPDLVDGRSPWFDDPGGTSGRWVHGVYTGKLPVDDIGRLVEHFTALYDSEIRYVDRAVGEMLDAIPEEVLENTLIVLTADHGEELYDHGGWKHGHTLYEDQIHVPLVFRWDRRIEAGRRLPGTVRLIDVAPTILAAAGGPESGRPPASWQGENLLSVLTGEAPLPRLASYSENLQVGPLRAATVADGWKLFLYNQTEPFEPANALQTHISEVDSARLARVALFDLEADPGETSNLAAPPGGGPSEEAARRLERLEAILYHRLDRTLPGLRAMTERIAPGSRLTGELVFERPPEAAIPLFLSPEDRVSVDGARVRFELTGEAIDKGFRLTGAPGALLAAALELDGEPLSDPRLRIGEGRPFGGRRVGPEALRTGAFPDGDRGGSRFPGLRLWSPAGAVSIDAESSEETLERLKALGYVE